MSSSVASTSDSRARQQQLSTSRRRSDDSVASDAVYTSHYTSSFAREDLLVARIVWLRQKARQALLDASKAAAEATATRPRREPSRGRPRYRDCDYY